MSLIVCRYGPEGTRGGLYVWTILAEMQVAMNSRSDSLKAFCRALLAPPADSVC